MKLIVQIPCLNEEHSIAGVIKGIPRRITGIDKIDILIIDDGSNDNTVKIAKSLGVKHFVKHTRNQGLGQSFHDGVLKALELGADIIVNLDGDNQHPPKEIGRLVKPIVDGVADIVIANRQVQQIEEFSLFKKFLQKFGSWIVSLAAGTDIPDAACGLRAYSREAVLKLNTITRYSYCMETIIQAGNKRLAINSVKIKPNPQTRPSRLFKSTSKHVLKSMVAIMRSYTMYKPYVIFSVLGGILLLLGLTPFIRYLILYINHQHSGHLQSLLVGGILLSGAFMSAVLGVLADLTRTNRVLIETQLEITKRNYLENIQKPKSK